MNLLTVNAAAQRLGIGYSTLKQWIYTGKVRTTTTPGGHHRVSDAEIARLMAHQPDVRQPPAPKRASGVLVSMSARNKLRGFVDEVRVDGLLAQVRIRIGDQMLTAVVTADAIAELKITRGDDILAIVKSTEVMLGREAVDDTPRRRRRRTSRRRTA
jgi:molybdopterin-binding protein